MGGGEILLEVEGHSKLLWEPRVSGRMKGMVGHYGRLVGTMLAGLRGTVDHCGRLRVTMGARRLCGKLRGTVGY